MAGDSRKPVEWADEELVSAIFEISRARTLLVGVTEALPEHFQMYGSDIEQLLDRAIARLRWVKVTGSTPPVDPKPPPHD